MFAISLSSCSRYNANFKLDQSVFAIHDSPLYYEISDDHPPNSEQRTVTIEIIDTDCVLLCFLCKFVSAKWRIYKGIFASRLPSEKECRAFK
jgi:hypothetical protein